MNDEGVSSLAVVDNHSNVVGNISNVDVKVGHPSDSRPVLVDIFLIAPDQINLTPSP